MSSRGQRRGAGGSPWRIAACLAAAEEFDATVANMRFVKPLDETLVLELARGHDLLVTVEENVVAGGAGSAVLEALERRGVAVPVLQLGLPDRFIDHGDPALQLAVCGLDRSEEHTSELQSLPGILFQCVEHVVFLCNLHSCRG